MSVIISTGVHVGSLKGIQSVSISMNPSTKRLYVSGSSNPIDTVVTTQWQLNLTKYGGIKDLQVACGASTGCEGSAGTSIPIIVAGCNGSDFTINQSWLFSSYSYSKDYMGWGMETWGFTSSPVSSDGATPNMIQGVAEGSTGGSADTGVAVSEGIPGVSLSITAGSPGVGRFNNMSYGVVIKVTGGDGKADGKDGTANVGVPYTPIYF